MPRYFFQVTKNGDTVRPEQSIELPGIEAAWEEATVSAGELLKELDGALETGTEWTMSLQDEFRNELRSITVIAKAH